MTPDDVLTLRQMIREQRATPDPFDIVVGGNTSGLDSDQARSKCLPFAEAGATWWIEFVHPVAGDFAAIERRIRQGPPLILADT